MKLPLEENQSVFALSPGNAFVKRSFDLVVAILLLMLLSPVILALCIGARMSTGESGIFRQERTGLFGKPFTLYKIRSMKPGAESKSHVTTSHDPRITKFGRFVRRTKLDEFPQLINVIKGDMSFVGPRPDIPATYDDLEEEDAKVLCIRPGITGPASIAFKDEEVVLGQMSDPEHYNRTVIFPEKVGINRNYIENYSLASDIGIMIKTVMR